MASDHQNQDSTTETVYSHRYCGCVFAVRTNVSPEVHDHFTLIEGARVERRGLSSGTGRAVDIDRRCPHELQAAHVALWARREASSGLFLQIDGSRAMHLHAKELVRVGVIPSMLRPGIDIGFEPGRLVHAIRSHFGLDFQTGWAHANLPPASLNSWEVCERLGLLVMTAVMSDCLPDLDLPGIEMADRLTALLNPDPSSIDDECSTALLSFSYGAVALLAMGVERRLLAYWAYEFSRQTRGMELFGISIAQSLRAEMRYVGLLEPVLGPPLWAKFGAAQGLQQKSMLIARMAQNLLSYLTH